MVVLGWDVGGAHLKGARIEAGRVTAAAQVACPLWQGVERLHEAFKQASEVLGEAAFNAVTMTGELSDVFASRSDGVARLAEIAAAKLGGEVRVYGGPAGWLPHAAAEAHADSVASANWHATASWLAMQRDDALVIDMGSTTTDIVPIVGGKLAARGYSDAERLAAGELIYTGATRTFLMAVAQRVPFRGGWTPVMNEYFASMADAHRILAALPEAADRLPAADNREKTIPASCARLARMIGRDAGEAADWEWRNLAAYFAEAQLRALQDAALQVLSAASIPDDAPLVGAGTGRFVVERLASRLGRRLELWEELVPATAGLADEIGNCAPAVAVGLLLAAHCSPP